MEARLELLLKTAGASIWEYSAAADSFSGEDFGPIFGKEEGWRITRQEFFDVYLASAENDFAKEAWEKLMSGEDSSISIECAVSPPGGERLWTAFKGVAVTDGLGRLTGATGITVDITELKKAELAAEIRNRRLALINSSSAAFLEELDPKALLESIVVKACELAGTKHGLLSVYREEEKDFFRVFGTGMYKPLVGEGRPAHLGTFGEILRNHKRVVIRNYQAYEGRLKDPRLKGIGALIALPFFHGKVFRGILSITFTEEDPPIDDNMADSLEILAASAAIALRNAELYEESLTKLAERRKAQEDLRFHGKLARAAAEGGGFLVSLDNQEQALGFALRSLGEAAGAFGASLYRFSADGEGFYAANLLARYIRPGSGPERPFELKRLPRGGPLTDVLTDLSGGKIHKGLLEEIVAMTGVSLPEAPRLWCITAPVFYESALWGFLGLSFEEESLADRAMEEDALKTAAHNMAASVMRWEAEKKVLGAYEKLAGTFGDAIRTLGQIVGRKDPYTTRHQERVSLLALKTGIAMGLTGDRLEGLRIAGLVHDVGKVEIPSEILSKPGRLSPLEFDLIKTHAESGYQILKEIDFPWPVAEITRQHHERLDGSGYPWGLRGEEIMEEARILAVVDVAEAMASHRPYRPSLGIAAALDEIKKFSGVLYDARAASACVRVLEDNPGILAPW